jgi:parallel beta-helix repeat protein
MPWKISPMVLLALLVLGTFTSLFHIQSVRAGGAIYIRADGSIDPSDAPISTGDNVTYTLAGNITSDADGIVVERDNIVIDGVGYTATGSGGGNGTMLADRSNVTVRNMTIKNFEYGIFLDSSSDNTLFGNNVANNNDGVWFSSSDNNTLFGNSLTTNNWLGIGLSSSSGNTLFGNNVTNNEYGIGLSSSSGNTLFGNNFTANNHDGIWLYASLDNMFYHNNFVANTEQVYSESSANVWDDGPSGGNYWSDYNGTDANHDGIGDTPYVVDANNTDRYPLMNLWRPDATAPTVTDVTQIPNGTGVTPADEVRVNATVTDATSGVKKVILNYATNNTPFVSINMTKLVGDIYNATIPAFPLGTNVTYLIMAEDMNNNAITTEQLGFTYQYQVIPEFSSFLILALFVIMTLISVIACRKARARTHARTISGC